MEGTETAEMGSWIILFIAIWYSKYFPNNQGIGRPSEQKGDMNKTTRYHLPTELTVIALLMLIRQL